MAAVICGVCLWSRQGRETEVYQSESECERVGKGDKGRGIEEQSRDEEVDSFSQTQQTIGAGYQLISPAASLPLVPFENARLLIC